MLERISAAIRVRAISSLQKQKLKIALLQNGTKPYLQSNQQGGSISLISQVEHCLGQR
jgi:uncharacterized protein YerC